MIPTEQETHEALTTQKRQVDGLLPCPFCGGEVSTNTLLGTTAYFCGSCFAETKFKEVGLHIDDQEKRWLKRTSMPELCGFFVTVDGAINSHFPTKTYARLRKEELEACGWENVAMAEAFIDQDKRTGTDNENTSKPRS